MNETDSNKESVAQLKRTVNELREALGQKEKEKNFFKE